MRCERVPFLFIFCASVVIAPLSSRAQSHSQVSALQVEQSESEVAQALADQGQFILLPAEGRMKTSIKKDAKSFMLPGGESRVLLLKLPPCSAPYTLTVASPCNHGCLGFSKSIFVPSGMFLDAGFQPARELPAAQFESLDAGLTKPYRLEATILIDEARKDDRYLLLYTIGEGVGDVVHSGEYRNIKASANGSLELTTRPADRGPFDAEATRAKDAQAVHETESRRLEGERVQAAPQAMAPSAQLFLSEPERRFPAQALDAFVRSPRFQNFDVWLSEGGEHWLLTTARNPRLRGPGSDSYQFQAGRYNVLVVTPILDWYLEERDTIKAKKREAKRQKKSRGASEVHQLRWDWSNYEDNTGSVVRVLAIPDFCQTTLSWLLSGVFKEVTQLKYKTSFSEMSLLCDGKENQPINRQRFQVELPGGYGAPEGAVAFAGAYEYSFEAFDRSRCRKLELRIVSEAGADNNANAVPGRVVQQVWTDFEGYRNANRGR